MEKIAKENHRNAAETISYQKTDLSWLFFQLFFERHQEGGSCFFEISSNLFLYGNANLKSVSVELSVKMV